MSKSCVQLNIPYFSQWESPELLTEENIKMMFSPRHAPHWRNSGAEMIEEYEAWVHHICGIACFKMILKAETGITYETMALVRLALEYSCLDMKKGLYYKPFCTMASSEFSLKARFSESLTINEIKAELASGNYVIASVHSSIRAEKLDFSPPHKGGHLILFTGYTEPATFSIHDPAGLHGNTQEHRAITAEEFMRFSPLRGIIIYSNHEQK